MIIQKKKIIIMKTLGKLKINIDRVLKNEELVNLRGGYEGGYGRTACCRCDDINGNILGFIVGSTESECHFDCLYLYDKAIIGWWDC